MRDPLPLTSLPGRPWLARTAVLLVVAGGFLAATSLIAAGVLRPPSAAGAMLATGLIGGLCALVAVSGLRANLRTTARHRAVAVARLRAATSSRCPAVALVADDENRLLLVPRVGAAGYRFATELETLPVVHRLEDLCWDVADEDAEHTADDVAARIRRLAGGR
ncbi:hypothetical protein ICW40_14590 [Actinotalea ferrariae]|uniref:hypothetical protein n=1 Tax=Actinotalea ferrariae TaxID=1386098 RepID=UPI001C8C96FC|nr:hypothetical protein [Actinotalea ferrariae]MBX9246031.1 hypothetical protein [Actinotalea ferrariae]